MRRSGVEGAPFQTLAPGSTETCGECEMVADVSGVTAMVVTSQVVLASRVTGELLI